MASAAPSVGHRVLRSGRNPAYEAVERARAEAWTANIAKSRGLAHGSRPQNASSAAAVMISSLVIRELGGRDLLMNNFATFWQRFAATGIDLLILFPLMLVQARIGAASKNTALALAVPWIVLAVGYSIYCHGRFGKTIGKSVMGIRVSRLTGERIGWREAWLRSSVEMCLAAIVTVGWLIALASTTDAEFYGAAASRYPDNVSVHQPPWAIWASWVQQTWFWSELVTMLFNKRRRALHDFVAGTVVISDRKALNPQPPPPNKPLQTDVVAAQTSE